MWIVYILADCKKHKRFPMILVSLNEAPEAPKEVIKKALEHTNNLQNDLYKKNQQVASPKVRKLS